MRIDGGAGAIDGTFGSNFSGKIGDVKLYNRGTSAGSAVAGSAYSDAVVADHPVGYWRLNDATATTAHDSVSSSPDGTHWGTITAGPPAVQGGGSYVFDGTNSEVEMPGLPFRFPNTLSVEAWINTTSIPPNPWNEGFIFGNYAFGYRLVIQANGVVDLNHSSTSSTGVTVSSPGSLFDGKWHYVVGTKDGSALSLYIDGKLVGSEPDTSSVYYDSQTAAVIGGPFWLNAGSPTPAPDAYFEGDIADVAVYNYSLSAAQVAAHFAAGGVISTGPTGSSGSTGTTGTHVDYGTVVHAVIGEIPAWSLPFQARHTYGNDNSSCNTAPGCNVDNLTGTVDWGDGSTSPVPASAIQCTMQPPPSLMPAPRPSTTMQCAASVTHIYTRPATFAVTLSVDPISLVVDNKAIIVDCIQRATRVLVDDKAHGWKIKAVHDVLHATRVAIIVPGVQNDYKKFDASFSSYADHLGHEITLLYGASAANSTAVIAWLGYNPPDDANGTLGQAVGSGNAMNGALNLAVFVRCLRIDSKVPGFSLTVIGHSYGSTVVGLAAAKTGALDGDNVVFVGSPGVDAHSVRELGQPKAVYAGENPNDFIQLFTDPAVQYLNNSLVSHQLVCHALLQVLSKFVGPWDVCGMLQQMAHGPNPTGLVDARHHFSTEGECGHGYFDDPTGHGTEGLQNLARITMGDGAQVTQERRAPIAPFTVHVNGTIKVQAGPFTIVQLPNITGITVNWTVSCKNPAQADSGARLIDVANYDATSDVLSTTTAGLNIVVPKGSAQKMASVSVHVQARTSEQLNMTLVAPGGKKAGAASATSHRPITIIATGEQTAAHAGHVTVRMRITSKGLRYLQAAAAHGITTLTPILAVQIRVRGRLGYFAGPVPVRVHV